MRLFTTFPSSRVFRSAVLWLVIGQGVVLAQDPRPSAEARFQKAWYLETGENEYAVALEAYEGLAADGSLERPLRARALYRAGVCLRKLGRHSQAMRTYQRVLQEFPGETFVVAAARREVEGESEEEAKLREQVGRIVTEWPKRGGRARRRGPSASHALEELGPRAGRFVLDYLQETPPSDENAQAREDLAETVVRLAADDPALRLQVAAVLEEGNNDVRATLVSKMDKLWLAKFLELARQEESSVVRGAALRALGRLGEWPEEASAALADSDPVVRVAALDALEEVFRQHPEEEPIAPGRMAPVFELFFDRNEDVVAKAVTVLGAAQKLRDRQEAGGVLPIDAQGKRLAARLKEVYRRPGISQDAVLELLLPGRWGECFEIVTEDLGAKDEVTVRRALYGASRLDPGPGLASGPTDVALKVSGTTGTHKLVGKARTRVRFELTAPLIALLGDRRTLSSDSRSIPLRSTLTGPTALTNESVDSAAWNILSSWLRTPSVLEALVAELPRVDASSIHEKSRQRGRREARSTRRRSTRNSSNSRVGTVLSEVSGRGRRDLFLQALGRYDPCCR